MLDLTGLNQFLHRASDILYGHVRINTVLIQQVDALDLEPFERAFDGLLDVLGPTIQAGRSRTIVAATQIESELRGDHHFAVERRNGLAHEFFVDEWTIDLGGVEERDASVHCRMQKVGHLPLIFGRAVGKAHSHAAEPDGRNFQIAFSQFALLHCLSFQPR